MCSMTGISTHSWRKEHKRKQSRNNIKNGRKEERNEVYLRKGNYQKSKT